ncbi:GHMP family kinase ATP-binding protein [Streptomyces rishiriensis]|uniref:GHMP family kinase ATP-binding protein n=1 Tax=Streptomyces rishiriensis TaxID=68264 RepID=UPI0037D60383
MQPVESGRGRAVGTCGELVQGTVDGRELMVTFPVDWYSDVVVRGSYLPGVRVWPRSKVKVRRMCDVLLDRLVGASSADVGLDVLVSSMIPEGRGHASSSADLTALCRAMAQWLGVPLADDDIMRLCCELEPSDAVCRPVPTLFDFIRGEVLLCYDDPPPMAALVLDEGGAVDTVTMRRLPCTEAESERLALAFDLVDRGFRLGDLALIGRAAMISAEVNQRRVYKRNFEVARDVADACGSYGVSVAHSGTTLALLFDQHEVEGIRAAHAALRTVAADCELFLLNAVVPTRRPAPDLTELPTR